MITLLHVIVVLLECLNDELCRHDINVSVPNHDNWKTVAIHCCESYDELSTELVK